MGKKKEIVKTERTKAMESLARKDQKQEVILGGRGRVWRKSKRGLKGKNRIAAAQPRSLHIEEKTAKGAKWKGKAQKPFQKKEMGDAWGIGNPPKKKVG